MEGERLLKVNQAFNTLADEVDAEFSPAVVAEVVNVSSLTHKEQLQRYAEVAGEVKEKAREILEIYPDGRVTCKLGSYHLELDDKSISIAHIRRPQSGAAFAMRAGHLADATWSEKDGMIVLAPDNLAPNTESDPASSLWYGIFDARETLEAIHGATVAGSPAVLLGSTPYRQ